MNKNSVYLAVFAVLCVLAGVLMGASITKHQKLTADNFGRQDFRRKAERSMGYGSRESKDKRRGGPIEMLSAKLELSAEQKVKVTQILEEARQGIDEAGKDIRSAITRIKEKGDQEIMAILTPAQQEKFKELQQELKKKFESRRAKGQSGRSGERLPPVQQ
jgi:Spy/CpxP family protein refolding chaperone